MDDDTADEAGLRGPTASAAADEDGDGIDDDAPLDEAAFDRQFESAFDDSAFDAGTTCGPRLRKGALVHEATVDRSGAGPVVVAVKLVRRR